MNWEYLLFCSNNQAADTYGPSSYPMFIGNTMNWEQNGTNFIITENTILAGYAILMALSYASLKRFTRIFV